MEYDIRHYLLMFTSYSISNAILEEIEYDMSKKKTPKWYVSYVAAPPSHAVPWRPPGVRQNRAASPATPAFLQRRRPWRRRGPALVNMKVMKLLGIAMSQFHLRLDLRPSEHA